MTACVGKRAPFFLWLCSSPHALRTRRACCNLKKQFHCMTKHKEEKRKVQFRRNSRCLECDEVFENVSVTERTHDRSHLALNAQLVAHCTGNAKVMGSNPVQSLKMLAIPDSKLKLKGKGRKKTLAC